MDAELLRQYLEFYQDLGIKTLYKQKNQARPRMPPAPRQPTWRRRSACRIKSHLDTGSRW